MSLLVEPACEVYRAELQIALKAFNLASRISSTRLLISGFCSSSGLKLPWIGAIHSTSSPVSNLRLFSKPRLFPPHLGCHLQILLKQTHYCELPIFFPFSDLEQSSRC